MSEPLHIIHRALGESTRRPDITVYRNGRIDITSRISGLLDLQTGDVIDVCSDGSDWYLYIRCKGCDCVGRHEAQVFPTNKGKRRSRNFRVYSRKISGTLLDISGADKAKIIAGAVREYSNIGKAVIIIPRFNLLQYEQGT